jgi:hypothetical protein
MLKNKFFLHFLIFNYIFAALMFNIGGFEQQKQRKV